VAKNCNDKNPLTRGGSSQKERLLAALGKDYVHIDEHSMASLLVFAREFSEELKYYDFQNLVAGDWSDFFRSDVSILIAIIAENNVEAYEQGYQALMNALTGTGGELPALFDPPNTVGGLLDGSVTSDLPSFIPTFKKIFDFLFSLAAHLDRQVDRLPEKTDLRAFARSIIQQHCQAPFTKLLGMYKAGIIGVDGGTSDYTLIDNSRRDPFPPVAGIQQFYTQDIIQKGLKAKWLDTTDSWADFYSALDYNRYQEAYGSPDPSMDTPEDVEQRLLPALKSLNAIFESLMKAISQIVFEAPKFLQETMEDWPGHQPHIALYLAFLQLYAIAQKQLNGLKERHVDYYYKEVLRLKEKGATPDEVHLLIELAKQVEDYLLKEGTAFKAGKDSEGNEVVYKAQSDTALNKAEVSQLKSVYYTEQNGKIYAAPIANSEDGLGAELLSPDGQWKPFGPVTRFRSDENQAHPEIPVAPPADAEADTIALYDQVSEVAEVGFAIASPNLFLREGERTITLELTAALLDPTAPPLNTSGWQAQHFSVYLTGEEGWIQKFPDAPPTFTGGLFKVVCTLTPEDPPVLPYAADIHLEHFSTEAPIIKVMAREHNNSSPYNELKKLKIKQVRTEVSVDGVKNLIVQNELGRLDPSKPFLPFGGTPHIGSALIIGNKEVFQKKLASSLSINIEWDGLADAGNSFAPVSWVYTGLDYLENSEWKDTNTSKLLIKGDLSDPQSAVTETGSSRLSNIGRTSLAHFKYGDDKPFSVNSKDGFIRLRLKDNFGHKKFMRVYPQVLIELSKESPNADKVDDQFDDGGTIVLKDPPYTPTFKELSLDYTAASNFGFNETDEEVFAKRTEQFFHLGPFGQRERHPLVNKSGEDVSLVPLIGHEGNLYIGLENLKPKQSVSILFQVAEGSANPLAEKQEVEWYYLYQNNWMAFSQVEDGDVADSTNGLLQSGIIQFFLPRKINDDNTLLPPGYTWLRASVGTSSDAISNIIGVDAQAVKATFSDQSNAEDFLATPLEAGTIKKLQQTAAAVKKVNQPFSSFGGKVKEQRPHFYKRVSERLRHKDRAITIWDYEHLVLEAFPEIYKAKCLNHTRLRTDPDDPNRKIINEVAPGYVLFVAVPDLKQRNAVDPLKPYTSLNTLDQIKRFLQKRISPHVQLDVVNPLFESIQLDFEVEFHSGRDFTLYSKILEQEIIQFLSPWAFDNGSMKELEFGGSICKSVLLDFVEERPYVDFVTQFRMDQFTGPSLPDLLDIEEARASTSRSILVSHSKHHIKEVVTHCV